MIWLLYIFIISSSCSAQFCLKISKFYKLTPSPTNCILWGWWSSLYRKQSTFLHYFYVRVHCTPVCPKKCITNHKYDDKNEKTTWNENDPIKHKTKLCPFKISIYNFFKAPPWATTQFRQLTFSSLSKNDALEWFSLCYFCTLYM